MMKGTRCRAPYRVLCSIWLGALSLAFSGHASAASGAPVVPPASSGSYSVTYQRCSGCAMDWLEERVGDTGAWHSIGSGSASFSNKPLGRYSYRVAYLYLAESFSYHYIEYGPVSSVNVSNSLPKASSLDAQLSYRYEARRGDVDGDGLTDFYLARVAGGVSGDGTIDKVILRQGSGARFTAVVPTAADELKTSSWAAAALRIFLKDVNVDGFVDLVLHDVAGATGVGGLANQIVYAPGQILSYAPKGVRAVDSGFKRFATDAVSYLREPNFFRANAPLMGTVQIQYRSVCGYYPGGLDSPLYGYFPQCYSVPVAVGIVYQDFSGFNQPAVSVWSYESAIESKQLSAKSGLDKINGVLEGIVGVPVGGWSRAEILDSKRPIVDSDVQRGIELFTALLRIGEASAATPEESGGAGRTADAVYITGRRVIGFLPMHTALEYRGSTISAYDSDDSLLGDGTLVSEVNWTRDRPLLTMTLGTVAGSLAPALYWARLLGADGRYRDNLPYDALPSIGSAGYNSNGYSHGIVQATAGVPSISMSRFVGGEKPVPSSAF